MDNLTFSEEEIFEYKYEAVVSDKVEKNKAFIILKDKADAEKVKIGDHIQIKQIK